MRRIVHKYYVSLQLLEEIENYVSTKNPTMDELLLYFRRFKLRYRHGLAQLDDR